jgi:hypothetical protein
VTVETLAGGEARDVETPEDGKPAQTLAVDGLERLSDGRGTLVLSGAIREKDAPANLRMQLHVGRNLLEIVRETGAVGEALTFRDGYRGTSSTPI